jgi:hypothetical protein
MNPYEPPTIPAEPLEIPWPEEGVYRDRGYIVLHHRTKLPPICVRTGLPADVEQWQDLVGGTPNDGSIPPTGRGWFTGKYYNISVPLSSQAVRTTLWYRRILWILVLGVLPLLLLIGVLGKVTAAPAADMPFRAIRFSGFDHLLVWPLIGLMVCAGLLADSRKYLRLECIARGYFWLANGRPGFLVQLPAWPVPPPSWWRQLWFGPSGNSAAWKPKASQAE